MSNLKKWSEALRSGEYTQTRHRLRTPDSIGPPRHCCLGVACDVYRKETGLGEWSPTGSFRDGDGVLNGGSLSPAVQRWLGVKSSGADLEHSILMPSGAYQRSLVAMNDVGNASFEQIADVIDDGLVKTAPGGAFRVPAPKATAVRYVTTLNVGSLQVKHLGDLLTLLEQSPLVVDAIIEGSKAVVEIDVGPDCPIKDLWDAKQMLRALQSRIIDKFIGVAGSEFSKPELV